MSGTAALHKERANTAEEAGEETLYAEELRRIWRNRRAVKAELKATTLLRYLFVEYRKIRAFGNLTHIFFPRLFPSGMRLSADVGPTFAKYLQPSAVRLIGALSYALRSGWPHLDKKEYNLLVVFNKLLEKIASTDFARLDANDRNLVEKFRSLESHFLVVHFRPEYPAAVVSALEKIQKKELSGRREELRDAIQLAKKMLNREDELPSLYNFLLGLNMLRYRRYFELRDLIDHRAGEMVSSDVFECEKQTQEEIDYFIEDSKRELVSLHKRKLEILQVKSYLPRDESGRVDFRVLEFFYESNEGEPRRDFGGDQENLFLFAARLLKTFLDSFENILNGKIHVSGVGSVELFARNFFQTEFTKLRGLTDKLEAAAYGIHGQTSYAHYLLAKSGKRSISADEGEAFGVLGDALGLLADLGRKLDRILHSRIPSADTEGAAPPLDAGVLRERAFVLPYENRMIKFKTKLGGCTVGEALAFIVTVCFLAAMFFRKEEVYDLVGDEVKVDDAIRTKLEMLERVGRPGEFRELRERYHGCVHG